MDKGEALKRLEDVCKGKGIRVVHNDGVKGEGLLFIGALKLAIVGESASTSDIQAVMRRFGDAS